MRPASKITRSCCDYLELRKGRPLARCGYARFIEGQSSTHALRAFSGLLPVTGIELRDFFVSMAYAAYERTLEVADYPPSPTSRFFRQVDVHAVTLMAHAVGLRVASIKIGRDGGIEILTAEAASVEIDAFAEWKAKRDARRPQRN